MNAVAVMELNKLTGPELKSLVSRGILQIVNTTDIEPSKLTYKDFPEYQKHAHLAGEEININEAARKYGISSSTISRWVTKEYISTIRWIKNRRMIDEADVAYCVEIWRSRNGQGKWLFNPDRTPYVPTTRNGTGE